MKMIIQLMTFSDSAYARGDPSAGILVLETNADKRAFGHGEAHW